jgi:hypothetical protein
MQKQVQIAKCKTQIANRKKPSHGANSARRALPSFCNLQFAICDLQFGH